MENKEIEVDHPSHYNKGKIEVITIIKDWKLAFCLGNAIKYTARCRSKGSEIPDLKKAIWYLKYAIKNPQMESIRYEDGSFEDDYINYDPSTVLEDWDLPILLESVILSIYNFKSSGSISFLLDGIQFIEKYIKEKE